MNDWNIVEPGKIVLSSAPDKVSITTRSDGFILSVCGRELYYRTLDAAKADAHKKLSEAREMGAA